MNTKACRYVAAMSVLFLVFLFSPILAHGKTVQQRWGPVAFDIPDHMFDYYPHSPAYAPDEGFVVIMKGKMVRGVSSEGHPRVTIRAERTRDRGMTLKTYLDKHYADVSKFPGTTRPEKLADGVYAFYSGDSKEIVMQLSGTDILVHLMIGHESDELNQVIATIRPAR
ncbi:hypothetical protein LJC36_01655 [Desulfovibrio sp. OttesenSCG-928-C14]|nr:hypothetical protein [Desulfovibrio sp. OttesenSCG-928-C14]